MRRISSITGAALACFLAASSLGWADADTQATAAATDTTTGQSTTEIQPERGGFLGNEKVAIVPQAGFISYSDYFGKTVGRLAYGATIDFNLPWFVAGGAVSTGIETGLIASHMGAGTSNFFGSSPNSALTSNNAAGANMFIFPVDLKLGYVVNNMIEIGAHGGMNFTYRTIGNATYFGSSTNTTGAVWRPYPNVGADLQVQFMKNVAFIIRPDVTITPGNDMFTGTIGLNFFLG